MKPPFLFLIAGLAFGLSFVGVAAPAPAAEPQTDLLPGEIVNFPGVGPAPIMLEARLLRPAGDGPFPAVTALHGCGGLYRRGGAEVSARDRDWALRLRDQGYLVLMVDSFSPRGFKEVCKLADRPVRQEAERKGDAAAALAYLRNRADVAAPRIGLIGWSHGGGTALAAMGYPPQAGYRAAVIFYPGCGHSSRQADWRPQAPLLLLTGDADDWTPPAACRKLAARHESAGLLELVIYPGATHDFDAPGRTEMRTLTGIPSVKGGEVHMATDPAARADAQARVDDFFRRHLMNNINSPENDR
jgi:dienelactone hydrolase